MHSQKILITGGAGFIGSNLSRLLLNQGHTLYVTDNLITGKKENLLDLLGHKKFNFFQIDVTTNKFVTQMLKCPIDIIYHLACPTGVPNIKKYSEEMLMTCSVGTKNVLSIAKHYHTKVLLTSSCEIYGQPEVFPQKETYTGNVATIGPRSPYEEGKRFAESLFAMYKEKYGVDAKIVRIFNTYGPGMSLSDFRVIPQFISALSSNNDLRIYGNGKQTRTHLYIDDLLQGLLVVMEKGVAGNAYNIGGKVQTSIVDLAQLILQLTRGKNNIEFVPHFIEDHNARMPSVEKVEALGWQQTITLQDGLTRMLASYNIPLAKLDTRENSASQLPQFSPLP